MDVLYRTISCEADGWHVASVDADEGMDIDIFPTREEALAWCRDQAAIPPPDFAEGGLVLAPVLDGDEEED